MFDQTSIKRQQLKMKRYDVAISGCGPVGAMLSLLLAKGGLKVLVIEKELKVLNRILRFTESGIEMEAHA